MSSVKIIPEGRWLTAKFKWAGRNKPMLGRFYIPHNDPFIVKELLRRIGNPWVQKRLEEHEEMTAGDINKIKEVRISQGYPVNTIKLSGKTIKISYDEARSLHGSKIAVVLSGGSDRALAHIGFLLALEALGIFPDYILGTSGGAIIAALRALSTSAKDIYEIAKKIQRGLCWQDILKFNFARLRDNPALFSGLDSGEKLMRVIDRLGLKRKRFSDTKIKLLTACYDINKCRTYVMGDHRWLKKELSYDLKTLDSGIYAKNMHLIYPEKDPLLSMAIRSSIGIPLLFSKKQIRFDKKDYGMQDGGIGEQCMIKTAANIIPVGTIIASSLGFAERPVYKDKQARGKRLSGTPAIQDTLRLIEALGVEQMKLTMNNPELLRGLKSVRVINPGIFLPSPGSFMRAQDIILSAKVSTQEIFNMFTIKKFFARWSKKMIRLLNESDFTLKLYCRDIAKINAALVRDDDPIILKPTTSKEWKKLYAADGGKVISKPVDQSTLMWALEDAADAYGTLRVMGAATALWLAKESLYLGRKRSR